MPAAARPVAVSLAVGSYALSLAVRAIRMVYYSPPIPAIDHLATVIPGLPAILVVLKVAGLVLSAWLLFAIARGKDWARIILLILVLISLPGLLMLPRLIAQYGVASATLTGVEKALGLVSLALLVIPRSVNWFKTSPPTSAVDRA